MNLRPCILLLALIGRTKGLATQCSRATHSGGDGKQTLSNAAVDRRDILGRLSVSVPAILAFVVGSRLPVYAEEGSSLIFQSASESAEPNGLIKPYAPIEALLPAIRVKKMIEHSVQSATGLGKEGGAQSGELLDELTSLLLNPRNLTQSASLTIVPPKPAKQYMKSYEESRQKLPLLAQPGAILMQQGEIMTWQRLKRRERASESADEIRAALNVYTNALEFDSAKYALTASPEKRKQLIRNDALPDVKSVIASDMGLRYLYRNDILSAMDEAKAELLYLRAEAEKEDVDQIDGSELLRLLRQAQEACDKWLSFIDAKDVQQALDKLKSESLL
jgi:hypothetical protein